MHPGLLTIVPTRGRPESVPRLVEAWRATGAPADAELLLAVDDDDPTLPGYYDAIAAEDAPWLRIETYGDWQPMVPKLNAAAADNANSYTALGFAGDDHVPRTEGWAGTYLRELDILRVGIVYGDDGHWSGGKPTEWAMSATIVRRLGKMVPARVEHLYCDDAIKRLGEDAGCLRYLPHVQIEHMHPHAGKAEMDEGYATVNAPGQYSRDGRTYARWRRFGRPRDVAAVRVLRAAAAGAS